MEFSVRDHTILFVIGGSRAYGLHTPESDVDVKGICIPPVNSYRLGILNNFEQADSKEHLARFTDLFTKEEQEAIRKDCKERKAEVIAPDGVIYDIQKFFSLALNANPNILEVLFCDDSDVRLITPAGEKIRENRDIFLSKKVTYSYMGYAYSQMKRIKTHRSWLLNPPKGQPSRKDFNLPEDRSLLTQDEQNAFLWVLAEILKDKLGEFRLSASTREELEALDLYSIAAAGVPDTTWPTIQEITGAPTSFILAMQRERAYRNALAHWKSYLNWKKSRNPKRAVTEKKYGMDLKHASHLARLMEQGLEIIENSTLTVKLPPERKEYINLIRAGKVTFDELEQWFDNKQKELKNKAEKSSLRKEPLRKEADRLLIELQLYG